MTGGTQVALLADGRRLHLQHGPIDLIVEAVGAAAEVAHAYGQAVAAFETVLPRLVTELDLLKTPIDESSREATGPVARAMVAAVGRHRGRFVTPMAAVAGAVADHVLAALGAGRTLRRAYVNNGGDIAFRLSPGEVFRIGIVADADHPAIDGLAEIPAEAPTRGLATSGWRGRSHSLGIADAVTVLADDAARADVAATLIANAVAVDHPAIHRRPAAELRDDTDLGRRLVTIGVGRLELAAIHCALDRGAQAAESMVSAGLIHGAALSLQGEGRVVGAATAVAAPAAA